MIIQQENDSTKFQLYAVNTLLQVINELPLESETDIEKVLEGQMAKTVLVETTKEVLAEGWDFNKDDNYIMPADSNGFIAVPANILDISSVDGDVIMRDWRLYSKSNQSAIFEEAQAMNIIWDTPFNSLTHPLRNYITVRAARKFQARTIMDTSVYSYTQQDEEDAYIIARRSEGNTGRYNILTSSYGVSNLVY